MTDLIMLVGSLSNDLHRIANLTQRGSDTAAIRFLLEAKRWSVPLESAVVKPYVRKIAKDVSMTRNADLNLEKAETFLMYGTLLQNFALHNK